MSHHNDGNYEDSQYGHQFGLVCWLCQESIKAPIWFGERECRPPSYEGCPKHHGHKENLGVTLMTYGAGGERAQVILMWLRAPSVGNASHPQRIIVINVRQWAMRSLWLEDSKILKNTSFATPVLHKMRQYGWGDVAYSTYMKLNGMLSSGIGPTWGHSCIVWWGLS